MNIKPCHFLISLPNLEIINTKIPDSNNTNKSASDSLIPNDILSLIVRLEIDDETPNINIILKIKLSLNMKMS